MKSKLTLLSLFLAATLITSQVRAAEEKTTTVGPVATADKSPDKAASTDTTAPGDKTTTAGKTGEESDEAISSKTFQTVLTQVIGILYADIGQHIAKKGLATIQAQLCVKGGEGIFGCIPPYTIRSCGGVMCAFNSENFRTAILALCEGYQDFNTSGCWKNLPTKFQTMKRAEAQTNLCNIQNVDSQFVFDVLTILREAKICPSK